MSTNISTEEDRKWEWPQNTSQLRGIQMLWTGQFFLKLLHLNAQMGILKKITILIDWYDGGEDWLTFTSIILLALGNASSTASIFPCFPVSIFCKQNCYHFAASTHHTPWVLFSPAFLSKISALSGLLSIFCLVIGNSLWDWIFFDWEYKTNDLVLGFWHFYQLSHWNNEYFFDL